MKNKKRLHKKSEWLEKLSSLSPEEKAEYLARKVKEGRRQAHLILGSPSKSTMTREEVRDMFDKEYPGLTLSDQITKDREAGL